MEPVLQRLGDVTIQRLEKPKGLVKQGPQSDSSALKESKEEEGISSSADEDSRGDEPQGIKRTSESSNLIVKKMKFEEPQNDKKCDEQDELSGHNFSDNDITDYDSDLDSESELEHELRSEELHEETDEVLQKTSIQNVGNEQSVLQPSTSKMVDPSKDDDEESNGESFFEKLVEQAEVATTPTSTPDSTPPKPSDAVQDEDYEIDIKEKLKEMGEITFGTVKKGDKPKKSDISAENEVVITSKKPGADEEVLGTAKGMLRRNIREVMDETKLDEATLAAQRLEAERLRRVQEQQRVLREYQRQAAQERAQQRAAALLQGNNYNKPGASQTRIGNTVLVKLPNGQTKPMTKFPRPPYEFMRATPSGPPLPPGAPMSALKAQPRSLLHKKSGSHLTPSVSIAPVGKRPFFPPMMKPHSDSDSENEDKKPIISPEQKQKAKEGVQTIDISSDDDCIVVSDPEADQDESDHDDPSNSGMHTNDEFNQPDDQGRVLVNVAHAEDEPDVFVAPQIARIIKPHQIGGVRFLYDNLIESVNRFATSTGFGCILAHSMGLGKTLQIVTFSDIFLRFTPARTVLCIMPINTLQNWMAEFNIWLPTSEAAPASPLNAHGEVRPRNFNIFVLNDSHKTLPARARVIREWSSGGGVLMIGYEQYRLLSLRKTPKTRKKNNPLMEAQYENDKNRALFDEVHRALVQPGPDLVICDEGHRIKNSHASISQALKQMRTKRRVVLTGYPLQNNLMEYWCMVDFVRPNYLGTKTEFCNMFERPIMNGQCIDSTETDIKLMRYRAHVLHSLLVGFVQRRSHTVLHSTLPQKEEYVLLVRMTPFQRKLYDRFMNEVVRKQSVPNPLKAFAVCCKIWNHPDVLYNFLRKKAGGDAVDIDLEEVVNTVSGISGTSAPNSATELGKTKRGAPPKSRKISSKDKNDKPAASVTPYNSNSEANNIQIPPVQTSSGIINEENLTNSNAGPITSFANTISQGLSSYGNRSTFEQNRTSFEDINFEDPPISQPYYDTHFDQNAQFPSTFPSSSSNFNLNNTTTNVANIPSSNSSNINESSNSNNGTNLFNMDTQQNAPPPPTQAPPLKFPSFANLPSGISLTPLGNKTQNQNTAALSNSTSNLPNEPQKCSNISDPVHTGDRNQQGPQNAFTFDRDFPENFNQACSWGQKQDGNDQENNLLHNQNVSQLNSNSNGANSNQSWIKQEETKPSIISNQLVSPKSETSNDSKPKINIISDIKLPPVFSNSNNSTPEKKINIISDIKIEPKKEEGEEKMSVKQEIEKLKNEIKNELKIEDDIKNAKQPIDKPPVAEIPLPKLNPLVPLMGTKEDAGIPYEWAIELLKDYVPGKIENSAKMEILFCIIRESLALGDRLLVFSQSLITLDLIEQFLQMSTVPGDTVKWAKNVSYYRLDGSTHALEREKLINEFNSNPKIHLFLVSTRAGSLGINLIGANRVVVLDASWNPCHDTQAVCRVYRYGQRKPCFVYRLVVDNCLEKKIYDRQVSKQGMSDRVVDECNPDAHLTIKDVSTLCFDDKKDEAEEKDWTEVKDNYIDVVLQKVLDLHGKTLNKEPFQHESLLVDRKEKQLSKHEKRQAKKGYEREKQASRTPAYMPGLGRGHRPVASVRPMQQGERPSRWIPAEHWQRQGMTAQEMTLPLDVVIPTNQPEKGNIVLKAGQKVLVLKSPKGVYMQLESGKIVAIKTAIKVKGKAEDGPDPMKMVKPPALPPHVKNHPSLSVVPNHIQKKPIRPFQPSPTLSSGLSLGPSQAHTKLNMRSMKQNNVPNFAPRMQSPNMPKKVQMAKTKPYNIGSEVAKSLQKEPDLMSGNSSEDEQMVHQSEASMVQPIQEPSPVQELLPQFNMPVKPQNEDDDELQKKIAQLKKNISIQRVSNQPSKQQKEGTEQASVQQSPGLPQSKQLPPSKQPPQPLQSPQQPPNPLNLVQVPTASPKRPGRQLEPSRFQQSTSRMSDSPSFHETLDSITSAYKVSESGHPFDDKDDDDDEDEEPEGDINEEMSDEAEEGEEEEANSQQQSQGQSDQSDDVAYISEEPTQYQQNQSERGQKEQTTSTQQEYNAQNSYGNYYNYNVPPYQPPPPQNYPGYPPQPPAPHYDPMAYPQPPPQPYNYNYQGYPQPHYPPPPPQPGYDYSNPHPPPHPPPVYGAYPPYPQQYAPPPHPPQGMYPPSHPPQSQQPQQQQQPYQDYSGYQSSGNNQYYQGS